MEQRLPLHPLPRKGESLGFYVTRLADSMGAPSAQSLLSATGLPSQRLLALDNWRLMEHLTKITGHDVSLFREACFSKNLEYTKDDSERHYGRLALREPHICPICRANERVVRPEWQYLPLTHCERHGEKLLSRCPNCGESFHWDTSLFAFGCVHCGTQWPQMAQGNNQIPQYQRHFQRANGLGHGDQFIRDLMIAAKRALRPFDLIIDSAPIASKVDDWEKVLNRAYRMLTDHEFIAEWGAQSEKYHNSLSLLGTKSGMQALVSLADAVTGDWPIKCRTVCKSPRNTQELISVLTTDVYPSRVPNRAKGLDRTLSVQANLQIAASLIGCHPSDVTKLWNENVIESTNLPKHQRYAFFNMQTFVERLTAGNLGNTNGLLPFKSVAQLLRFFDANLADVLIAMAKGKIPFHVDVSHETLVQGLWIHPRSLYRELVRRFKQHPDDIYLRYRLPKIIGVSQGDLDTMTRGGVIQATPAHGAGVFRKHQIVELTKKYFFAIRWSGLRNQRLAKVRAHLRDAGVQAIYGRDVYPRAKAMAALRRETLQ